MSQGHSNTNASASGSNAESSVFDQAMRTAGSAWETQSPSNSNALSREDALAIMAKALAEEIKSGKPIEAIYGRASLALLLEKAIAAKDIGIVYHLAHDVANVFGGGNNGKPRDFPENAGLDHIPFYVRTTGSQWGFSIETKMAIAEAAKAAWAPADSAFDSARMDQLIEGVSGAALYRHDAPAVIQRVIAGVAEGATPSVAKKRPSM